MLATHIPRIISGVLSVIQATTLRERYFTVLNRLELVEVALEDIERINSHSKDPNPLIANICANTRKSL